MAQNDSKIRTPPSHVAVRRLRRYQPHVPVRNAIAVRFRSLETSELAIVQARHEGHGLQMFLDTGANASFVYSAPIQKV
jgi:hypothetical protein